MKWKDKGHELDFFGNRFVGRKKIYIFGTGEYGQIAYDWIKFLDCVEGFIDSDPEKQKNKFNDKRVFALGNIDFAKKDFIILIALSEGGWVQASAQCTYNGLVEGVDFFHSPVFLTNYLDVFIKYALNKSYINQIDIFVTERCSLNCTFCGACVPFINNPKDYSYEDIIADIDLIAKYIDYVRILSFLGGEPFMHKNYFEIIKYAIENYRHKFGYLHIVTNGTIIPNDDFLDYAKQKDVIIIVSDYTESVPEIKNKVEQFLEIIAKKQIRFNSLYGSKTDVKWYDFGIGRSDDKFENENQRISHYNSCRYPIKLFNKGKMYGCEFDGWAQCASVIPSDDNSYLEFCTLEKQSDYKMVILEFSLGYSVNGYYNACTTCKTCTFLNKNKMVAAIQYKEKSALTLEKMEAISRKIFAEQ